jgi:outer membrane protein, multidrug efflux system
LVWQFSCDRFILRVGGPGTPDAAADPTGDPLATTSAASRGTGGRQPNHVSWRAEDRYKFGVDSYLNVITAQSTLLSNQRTAMNIRTQQMTASVLLIKTLGGGWEASRLASSKPGQ